jgi:hypothetical protein
LVSDIPAGDGNMANLFLQYTQGQKRPWDTQKLLPSLND